VDQLVDIADIIQKSAVYILVGAISWLFNTVRKNRRDMNCMFVKVRRLYRKTYGEEWEKHWDE